VIPPIIVAHEEAGGVEPDCRRGADRAGQHAAQRRSGDERRRFGFNPDKRSRLIRGGAMLLIPDFSDVDGLMEVLDSPVPVQSAFASADIGEAS